MTPVPVVLRSVRVSAAAGLVSFFSSSSSVSTEDSLELTRRCASSKPLLIKEIAKQVGMVIAEGADVINLSQGVPCLSVFPEAVESMTALLATGKLPYSDVQGLNDVRDSASTFVNTFYSNDRRTFSFTRDHCLVTAGGIQGCFVTLALAVESAQDVVLSTVPAYALYDPPSLLPSSCPVTMCIEGVHVSARYPSQCNYFGGTFRTVATTREAGFAMTADAIQTAFEEQRREGRRVRVLVVCSPNNPTGSCLDMAEAERIAAQLELELDRGEDFIVLLDEVYLGIERDKHVSLLHAAGPRLLARTVLMLSASKGLGAMPGLRAAWVTSENRDLVREMTKVQTVASANASTVAQAGLKGALDNLLSDPSVLEAVNGYYSTRTAFVVDRLNALGRKYDLGDICAQPSGTFYCWCDFSALREKLREKQASLGTSGPLPVDSDLDLCEMLLHLHRTPHGVGLAVVPGSAFSMNAQDMLLRISCAKDDMQDLERAVSCVDYALGSLLPVSTSGCR